MTKLTLSFKGHLLSVHHLDEKPTMIGRDRDCGICVDSLAVAPRHAELVSSDDGYLLLGLNPDYPVHLNGEQVDQASLHHGDLIGIGKHTLVFSEDSLDLAPARPTNAVETEPDTDEQDEYVEEIPADTVTGYMQIQSGRQIGRVVVFRRAITRLKRAGAKGVVVARNGDSYELVRLDEKVRIKIDGVPVADEDVEVALRNTNLVEIDRIRFQFFIGTADRAPSADGKN